MQAISIRSIEGLYIGHATDSEAATGCTVVICPDGATGAVAVQGGAPATRETDLLRPEETAEVVHAVVLSGGSAFGLAAADGVAQALEERSIGFDMQVAKVPIVSAACVFDLFVGSAHVRPTAAFGVAAVQDAFEHHTEPLAQGNIGAGAGCSAGKLLGINQAMKTGFGAAAYTFDKDLAIGALVAANPIGDIVDPQTQHCLAGLQHPGGTLAAIAGANRAAIPRSNTTISCIVTNAQLTKAQATKLAQMCGDAYARTIRPTHSTMDGDTIFCLATHRGPAITTNPSSEGISLDRLGVLANQVLEEAICNAARYAQSAHGLIGYASNTNDR